MILADTSVWIEFLRGTPAIAGQFADILAEASVLTVEPIFGELLQGARTEYERDVLLGYWRNLPRADIDGLWVEAGLRSGRNGWIRQGVGLIDAVLVTVTVEQGAQLWTLDRKLLSILPESLRYMPQ